MNWLSKAAPSLPRYGVPLLSGIALALVCTDTNYGDGRRIAVLLSGPIYKGFIVFTLAVLLLLAWRKRSRTVAWQAVEFAILVSLTTNFLKLVVPLARPPHLHRGVPVLNDTYSAGFPSAHTAMVFGLAWMVFEVRPSVSILWFAMAVAIAWSRIELYAHYPYQVLFGALIGSLIAWGISHYSQGIVPSFRGRNKIRKAQSLHAQAAPEITATKITAPEPN